MSNANRVSRVPLQDTKNERLTRHTEQVALLLNGLVDGGYVTQSSATQVTITGLDVSAFAASAIVIESEGIGSNDNDTTLPTSAAVKDYVDTTLAAATFADNTFRIFDNADNSKLVAFEVSGVPTGTTRTLTVPDANGTIVLNDNTATLTNKSGAISQWTNDSGYITASSTDTLTNKSGNISQWTNDSGYITATLTNEQVQDIVGAMVTGNTETLITVTYDDPGGKLNFVVDSDLSNYNNATSGFITAGSTSTLTNKSGNISQWTNDSGYITASGTDTLTNKTINTASNTITIAEADISDLQSYLLNVVQDTTPQLGGNLDINGNKIVSVSNGNIDIEPHGTGNVLLGNFTFDADQSIGAGQDNYVLTYDNGTGLISLEAASGGGGLSDVVDDATPQLGGNLDVNGNKIVSVSNGDIDIEPNGTGNVLLGNFTLDADQTITASTQSHVFTYEHSTGLISLQAPPAFTINGLGVAGATLDQDYVAIAASTDAFANHKILMSRFLSFAGHVCQGRLTLTTATPVTTSDVTSASTIYFTPYKGDKVRLHNGSKWDIYTFTERSLALTSLTSGLNYDVFLYDNSGTLTLELTAWTNDTTRATALTLQNGVYVKSGATTRLYLGTIRTTGTTTTEDSESKRFCWNMYNRVTKPLVVTETTNTWTYTGGAFRAANNSSSNAFEAIQGLAEDRVYVFVQNLFACGASAAMSVGIGLDSTTTDSSTINNGGAVAASNWGQCSAIYDSVPSLGYHKYHWLEDNQATAATETWYGDNGGSFGMLQGMYGRIWC